MYSFIVLGQIPGTNLHLSFEAWLLLMTAAVYAVYRYWPNIKKFSEDFFRELENPIKPRQGLHASQLHQRAL
jgi:hypothetical protein